MRGAKVETQGMFSYVSPEQRVSQDHSLCAIRGIVDRSLEELDGHFSAIYSALGRPSFSPEFPLRALLLQDFYSIRSERQLMEQVGYNLLFRWFVGIGMDEEIWVPTVFTKNRDRLLDHGTVREFFRSVLEQARSQDLLSEEHFSVDGSLLEAWASQKSFQSKDPEDRQGDGSDFRGQERSNETHASMTDPDVRLYKKAPGDASRLAYLGHVLMDNRHGLIAGEQVTTADGTAEVDAATQLVNEFGGTRHITLGADKGYDRQGFVQDLRDRNVTLHVARMWKGSAINVRTTRHRGLCHEHSRPAADRIHLRRDEHRGRDAENPIPWFWTGEAALLHGRHRLQPGPHGAIRGGLMGVACLESVKRPQKTVEMVKMPQPEASGGQICGNLAISMRFLQIQPASS